MTSEASPTDHLVAAFHRLWQDPSRSGTTALGDEHEQVSYAALFERVGRMAGSLRSQGVLEGQRIAIAMDRSAGQVIAILAVMVAGACPCPLEPRLGREELIRRFAMARIDRTIGDAAHHAADAFAGDSRFIDVDALPDAEPFWATALTPASPAFLLFTSGSSGAPKGVLQSHRGLLVNARGIVAQTRLGPTDRLLHVMPLHHTNGVNNQILAPLFAGSAVHVAPRFRAEEMPALMLRVRPTIVTGVPTMFARMLPFEFPPEGLAALRFLRCGSAPITVELHAQIEAKFGRALVVSYGLSEATCTSTMNPPEARRIGSVGRVLPEQDVHLESRPGVRVREPGREGEICIAGSSLMLGYLTDASAGLPESPGAVVRTGDLGRFDDDGYLFVTGRLKDIIIRGGENLSPTLIENVIGEIPGVAACCVVGAPDADLGEVPAAFVVREASGPGTGLGADRVVDVVESRLGRAHRPSRVTFIDALPENAVGKVDRKALRARAAQDAGSGGS